MGLTINEETCIEGCYDGKYRSCRSCRPLALFAIVVNAGFTAVKATTLIQFAVVLQL
jgi:hypothetical protein